mgnify:CR=1 FL=1
MDERPDSSQQLMDILLVMDEKGTLQAVSGVKDGELQTKNPLEDNNDLLRVDRHGDMFSNFFSNLWNQLKDPTRFHFFRVPEEEVQRVAADFRERESQSVKSRSLRSTRCSRPCRRSSRPKPGSSNSRRVRRSSPPGRPNRTRSTSTARRTSIGTASPPSACSGSRSRATGCSTRCYGASRPTRPSGCISTSTVSRTATTASSRSSPARTAG